MNSYYYVVSTSFGHTITAKRVGESASEVAKAWICSRHGIDNPKLDTIYNIPDAVIWEDVGNHRAVTVLAC
jgi:hypothetical protein